MQNACMLVCVVAVLVSGAAGVATKDDDEVCCRCIQLEFSLFLC